jgi:DNA-binding GntR family transcriptional regulator
MNPLGHLGKIAHETLQEKVYRDIRQGLIDGQFEPGSIMTIRALAAQLGTSVMPVREALQKLVVEQALQLLPSRSLCVPVLSFERFADICDARIIVEGAAARIAAKKADQGDIARIAAICKEVDAAIAARNATVALQKNREFHFAVYAAARQDTLMQIIEPLWVRVGPYMLDHFKSQIDRPQLFRKPNPRHHHVVTAIRSRRAAEAQAAISADIQKFEDWYRQRLNELAES